jgi:hypothetical protein
VGAGQYYEEGELEEWKSGWMDTCTNVLQDRGLQEKFVSALEEDELY